jgi:ferredoxin
MKWIKIEKEDLHRGLNALAKAYQCVGPVKGEKYHAFQVLDEETPPDFDFLNTPLSPKFLVEPQSEILFEYTLDEKKEDHHILKEVQKEWPPRLVVGIRPCDAAAFLLVRRNFDTEKYKDPYWVKAYESLTLFGLACHTPCAACFCTTAGGGPFDEAGLDALMVDAGEHFLVKTLTEKGEAACSAAGWETVVDAEAAAERVTSLKAAAESKITSTVETDNLKNQSTQALYDAPFWEDVSFSCINCGTCTYVCPTCWCFDIQDECAGCSGVRMRNWDSCMYPLFTLHGSGHNPRGTKLHRVRQRFMHKLKYYVDKYDNGIQCVGCGRCIQLCPVNIDIRKVCTLMNAHPDPSTVCPV